MRVRRGPCTDKYALVDDLRPGDFIQYGKHKRLVRFVRHRKGRVYAVTFSWRNAKWQIKTGGTCDRQMLAGNVRRIILRGVNLRETAEDAAVQDRIEHCETGRDFGHEGPSFVYFIAGAGLVKIGFSFDVEARLNQIQQLSPVRLELLGAIESGLAMEYDLHARFAHLRQHGEWFTLTPELRAFIQEATV